MRKPSPREVSNLRLPNLNDFYMPGPGLDIWLYRHLIYLKIHWNRCYYIPFTSEKLRCVRFHLLNWVTAMRQVLAGSVTPTEMERLTPADCGTYPDKGAPDWSARGAWRVPQEYSHSNSQHQEQGEGEKKNGRDPSYRLSHTYPFYQAFKMSLISIIWTFWVFLIKDSKSL